MKKLIIAVASALGFAFYANAAAEATIGSTFTAELLTAGPLNITEDEDGNPDTAGSLYWTAADGATIDSTVTLYDDGNNVTEKPTGVDVGNKFLAVDQSDVLNRHFLDQNAGDPIGTNRHGPVDIGNGLYIDTMVQFTAADTAPDPTSGDKLIVWLKEVEAAEAVTNEDGSETPAVEPATNLVVTAGYYDNVKGLVSKDYVISNITVNPNEWYRLTIRAIPDIGNGSAGFIVYIDKNYVAVGKGVFGNIDVGGAEAELNDAGAVFPSLMGPESDAPQMLTSVGFKGTGKIDNLSLSDVNPDFIELEYNYTVTWDKGVDSFKYKIDDEDERESISTAQKEEYLIELDADWKKITFTEIVYAEGYGATKDGIKAGTIIENGGNNNPSKIGAVQLLFAVGNEKFATIDDAIDATKANGKTIKLNTDIVVSSDSGDDVLSIIDDIVLDLAGKTISSTSRFSPVSLDGGAMLTVIDSEGTGKIIGGDNGSIYMGFEGGHVKIGLADSTSDGITDKGATIIGDINKEDAEGVDYIISVVQGKMDWDPTAYVDLEISNEPKQEADLWTVTLKGNEPSVVYVAQIGEEKYETLAEAITAATADGVETTVTLLADVTVADVTVAEGDVIDFNGQTFEGALNGTFKVNGGKYSTAVKNLIAPENAPYTTTDAVITMSGWQNVEMPEGWATTSPVYTATELTINSGTVTLGESTYTVPGQTLTVANDATFVVPADLTIYFVGSAVINGTITQNGTIVLAAANASIKAAEGLNITAGVANMKVVYSNDGVYALEEDSGEDPGDITWDDVDEIGDVELPGELIAGSVDIDKLKKYANDNGLTVADVATMDPVKFALGLAPTAADAAVDAAKENFKVTISFDADGNPVVDMQGDENFNVTPVVQGAVEVNGVYDDVVDGLVNGNKPQFFKAVIKFNAIQD